MIKGDHTEIGEYKKQVGDKKRSVVNPQTNMNKIVDNQKREKPLVVSFISCFKGIVIKNRA